MKKIVLEGLKMPFCVKFLLRSRTAISFKHLGLIIPKKDLDPKLLPHISKNTVSLTFLFANPPKQITPLSYRNATLWYFVPPDQTQLLEDSLCN